VRFGSGSPIPNVDKWAFDCCPSLHLVFLPSSIERIPALSFVPENLVTIVLERASQLSVRDSLDVPGDNDHSLVSAALLSTLGYRFSGADHT
jgi:hypothetical protein